MSGDLISLEDAIEAIASVDITDGTEPVFSGKQVIGLLKDLDAINPQEPKTGHWVMPVQDDGMSAPIYYQVRCSECGFDLDPQTWHQELHQYGADKYCPNCGCAMKRE